MSIYLRTIENVTRNYGCGPVEAQHYIDLREEGYSQYQAALMAGIANPPEPREEDPAVAQDDTIAERERCALICREYAKEWAGFPAHEAAAEEIEKRIRSEE